MTWLTWHREPRCLAEFHCTHPAVDTRHSGHQTRGPRVQFCHCDLHASVWPRSCLWDLCHTWSPPPAHWSPPPPSSSPSRGHSSSAVRRTCILTMLLHTGQPPPSPGTHHQHCSPVSAHTARTEDGHDTTLSRPQHWPRSSHPGTSREILDSGQHISHSSLLAAGECGAVLTGDQCCVTTADCDTCCHCWG